MNNLIVVLFIIIVSSSCLVTGQQHILGEAEVNTILDNWEIPIDVLKKKIGDDAQQPNTCQLPIPLNRRRLGPTPRGICLPYNDCPEIQKQLKSNGLTKYTINILRERICRLEGAKVLVCCTGRRDLIPSINECGIAQTKRRIIGGRHFEEGTHPWLVSIGELKGTNYEHGCGGSLITIRHVLTAAHCFLPTAAVKITHAIFGENSLSEENEKIKPITRKITRRLDHPDYVDIESLNDIALIEMDEDVRFTKFINPICLPFPFQNDDLTGKAMTIAGWGVTSYGSRSGSDRPIEAIVSIISSKECNKRYMGNNQVNIGPEQLCASSANSDACQGDSGGPIIYFKLRSYIMGIVSFGIRCGTGDFPGVYSNVVNYLTWIKENVNTVGNIPQI